MDRIKSLEENLREAACIGDIDSVAKLLSKGIDPNAKHDINGWTALHWAAKRGHKDIVVVLLDNGADKTVMSENGETPLSLATRAEVRQLLGGEPGVTINTESNLPIIPSYLKNPPIAGKVDLSSVGVSRCRQSHHNMNSADNTNNIINNQSHLGNSSAQTINNCTSEELVLKVRIAHCGDPDFIEVELPQAELTYYTLLRVCCEELGLTTSQVIRIRKLPDTLIRKDKDVQRLHNFQEIELVVAGQHGVTKAGPNGVIFQSNGTANGYQSIHLYKNQTILY